MSVVSSIMDGGPSRRVIAEMPVVLHSDHNRSGKHKSPQQKLDEFWKNFTTEAPGKATTVIPQSKAATAVAKSSSARTEQDGSGATTKTTQASFEEAAALCRAKVAKIVQGCRRINQKYRDPHFDLELDLKTNRRDCLESLDNTKDPSDEQPEDDTGSDASSEEEPRRRGRQRKPVVIRGDNGAKNGSGAQVPRNREPMTDFRPKSVKRVGEIFDDHKFYIEGPTANDVRQGRDGDCWLMAALCTLSNKPGLIERICVARDEAVGVYGFVFHRDGEWVSEIIDDKLYLSKGDYDEVNLERLLWEDRDRINSEESYRKTYQSNSGALYFAQCEHPNETWLPLLEKAYAKAHGDYAAIEGGFTGEGIEDLTGGVTSELFTTDILDKEHFWKEELMKVNEQFLFGCSTGVWGRGWGERRGIYELHAYSVMKAREVDGQRLVLLKNPWGKGEWNGPWSDGSKEWTPEWLKKLDHRFGNDGCFFMHYDDLLKKYQAFDRTRLFGPGWKVASIWTTLSIPWTVEYHDTKFCFKLAKQGHVVLVLSQLDDRYFRGMEGQYRFELSFRVHLAGEKDYLVRSQATYRMNRSVNVELELDEGEYHVLVKIDATRNLDVMPVEDVVRANAKDRREKLLRIGLAYDLAHSKGKIVETEEEKKALEAFREQQKARDRKQFKEKMLKSKERDYYFRVKRFERNKKRTEKRRAKQKAKEEKRRAEEEQQMAEARAQPKDAKPLPIVQSVEKKQVVADNQRQKAADDGTKTMDGTTGRTGKENKGKSTVPDRPEYGNTDVVKDGASSTGSDVNTPSQMSSEKIAPEDVAQDDVVAIHEPREPRFRENAESTMPTPPPDTTAESAPGHESPASGQREDDRFKQEELRMSRETTFQTAESSRINEDDQVDQQLSGPPSDDEAFYEELPPPPQAGRQPQGRPPRMPPPPQQRMQRLPPGYRPSHGPPPPQILPRRGPPIPGPPRHGSMAPQFGDSEDDEPSSVSSLSELSDREVDYYLEESKRQQQNNLPATSRPQPRSPYGKPDDFQRDPWNAVAVVGFRVYHMGEENEEIVQLRVVRPISQVSKEDKDEKKDPEGSDEAKVLDLDDSAKDATLEEPGKLSVPGGVGEEHEHEVIAQAQLENEGVQKNEKDD